MLTFLLACASHVPRAPSFDDPSLAKSGKQAVDQMIDAYGGREAWLALGDVRGQFTDTWDQAWLAPWEGGAVTGTFTFNAELDKGRLDLPGGEVWGHDSVEGWIERDGERVYKGLKDAEFMVPTIAYFFQLPFRLGDPGAHVQYLGQHVTADGRRQHEVLVTFGSGTGKVQDRYLARIDARTGELAYLAFTVMDSGRLPQADATYTEWQDLDGVRVPRVIELDVLRPGVIKGDLHTMIFEGVHVADDFDPMLYEKPDAR